MKYRSDLPNTIRRTEVKKKCTQTWIGCLKVRLILDVKLIKHTLKRAASKEIRKGNTNEERRAEV